jgi:ribosomal protein L37E
MNARIYVVCRRCGHEREVARDDLIGGNVRHKPCPVCTHPGDTDDEREPVTAA